MFSSIEKHICFFYCNMFVVYWSTEEKSALFTNDVQDIIAHNLWVRDNIYMCYKNRETEKINKENSSVDMAAFIYHNGVFLSSMLSITFLVLPSSSLSSPALGWFAGAPRHDSCSPLPPPLAAWLVLPACSVPPPVYIRPLSSLPRLPACSRGRPRWLRGATGAAGRMVARRSDG